MKKIISFVLVLAMAMGIQAPFSYAASPDLDLRIDEARRVLAEAMAANDQSIPEELLAKCKAIVIYPNVLNGAFIFGARGGRGVVLRRDEKTGQWSPVAFSTIGGVSFGFQIGGQATDIILVILNERGLNGLLSNDITLGGSAAITAGPVGRKSEVATDLFLRAGILSYARTRGVFAGLALDGAVLTQDNNSNALYYGRPVTSGDILFGNSVQIQPSTIPLVNDLSSYSMRWANGGGAVYDRVNAVGAKPDYEGQIVAINNRKGEIVVINTAPAKQRIPGDPAEKKILVANHMMAGLQKGDRVKVYINVVGKENHAISIVKL